MRAMNALIVGLPLMAFGFGNDVKVHFHVVDEDGCAITNAVIRTVTQRDRLAPWHGGGAMREVVSRTDADGRALARFPCYSGEFNSYVGAPGYYDEESRRNEFKYGSDSTFYANLLEHEKSLSFTLRRKINPIPMYSSHVLGDFMLPTLGEAIGYDMKMGTWTSPYGEGVVSDFSVRFTEIHTNGCFVYVGELLFEGGGGAYKMKNVASKSIWSSYNVETNAVFEDHFVSAFKKYDDGRNVGRWVNIVEEDEHLVLRTRVKKDMKGNIVECNYSKLCGPLKIRKFLSFGKICFNPNVNDVNLEDDAERNLFSRRRNGIGVIP